MKIVQIDGFRGLVTATFVVICLFAGFILFPGVVAMNLWNKYLVGLYMFPTLNLLQGVLLWGIVAIAYAILTKNNLAISFKSTPSLSDEELNSIIKSAKIESKMKIMNSVISKSDKFEQLKKDSNKNPYTNKNLNISNQTTESTDSITTDEPIEEKVSNLK